MSGSPNDLMMPELCYRCGQFDCDNNGRSERTPPALMVPCRPRGPRPQPFYDEEELPLALDDAVTSFGRHLVASRRRRPEETPRTSQTQTPDTQTPDKPQAPDDKPQQPRAPQTQPTQPTQPNPSTPKPSPVPPGLIVIKPTRLPNHLIKIHPVRTLSPAPTAADGTVLHSPLTRCPIGRAKTTVKVDETTSLLIPNPRLRRALGISSSPVATQQPNRRGGGVAVEGPGSLTTEARTAVVVREAAPQRGRQPQDSSRTGDITSTEEHRPTTKKHKERKCIGWIIRWFTSFVSTRKVADGARDDTNAGPDDVSISSSGSKDGRVHGRNLDGGRRSDDRGNDDDRDIRNRDNQVLVDFLREGLSDVDSESE